MKVPGSDVFVSHLLTEKAMQFLPSKGDPVLLRDGQRVGGVNGAACAVRIRLTLGGI